MPVPNHSILNDDFSDGLNWARPLFYEDSPNAAYRVASGIVVALVWIFSVGGLPGRLGQFGARNRRHAKRDTDSALEIPQRVLDDLFVRLTLGGY